MIIVTRFPGAVPQTILVIILFSIFVIHFERSYSDIMSDFRQMVLLTKRFYYLYFGVCVRIKIKPNGDKLGEVKIILYFLKILEGLKC